MASDWVGIQASRSILLAGVLAASGCATGPREVYYRMDAANYTDEGVILYGFDEGSNKVPDAARYKRKINPDIPEMRASFRSVDLQGLLGVPAVEQGHGRYADRFPDDPVIYWQRATLRNCDEVGEFDGHRRDGRGGEEPIGETFTRKSGCDWYPTGPIREYELDLEQVRNSEPYDAATGLNATPGLGVSMHLLFWDDRIELDLWLDRTNTLFYSALGVAKGSGSASMGAGSSGDVVVGPSGGAALPAC